MSSKTKDGRKIITKSGLEYVVIIYIDKASKLRRYELLLSDYEIRN